MPTASDNIPLRNLIQVLTPFIYVLTEEEGRFIKWLHQELGSKKRHKFKVWKRSRGLMDLEQYVQSWTNLASAGSAPDESANINTALMRIAAEVTPNERHYYVFMDADSIVDGRDPMVLRRFLDLAEQVHMNRESFKSIILVSNQLVIPPKMHRMIRVADFELPSDDVLRSNLEEILKSDHLTSQIKVDVPTVVESMRGLATYEADLITLENLALRKSLTPDDVRRAKVDIIRKNPLLELVTPNVKFDDIGGMARLKDFLQKRRFAWTPEGKKYGLPRFRGVLTVGLPGNGKSLICKGLADEWGLPLVKFDPSKLFAGQVGASETNMRQALGTLERMAPCIAWVDEVEKGLAGMQSSTYSDSGTTARVIGAFLTWMQEVDKDVILMATANDVSNLPPELLRRFDETFFVGLPTQKEREEIFRIHIAKVGRDPGAYDLTKLARESENRSGAEIEKAISEALYEAYCDGRREMTGDDILGAVRVKPPIIVTMREQLSKIQEWVGKDEKTGDGVRARFAHGLEAAPKMEAV
jgi:ATP-dependent 26S proteasome regulatory subunit